MQIDGNFESGNIVVHDMTAAEAKLSIRQDSNARYYQWFYFKATAAPGQIHTFRLTNASDASYPHAWPGYRTLASYNRQDWFRVNTQYNENQLIIKHRPRLETTWYAFFVPYTEAMRRQLLADCAAAAEVETLLTTEQGKTVDLVRFGPPDAERKVWIIARQHAGEPMAEYAIDGLMRRLLDDEDAVVKALYEAGIAFYCVPNVNPDGSALGNLRANAAGIDLNRDWKQTLEPRSIEVAALLKRMHVEGVDFFLDLHGDENRPYLWLVQPHPDVLAPAMVDTQQRIESFFREQYIEYGSLTEDPDALEADSGMAVDYVAWTFKCPSFIIELPFKDTFGPDGEPDSLLAEGCIRLGRSCLDLIQIIMI